MTKLEKQILAAKFLNTTPGDIKVIKCLCNGLTVPEISTEIGINVRTLERRILNLKKTFQCSTLVHLAVLFVKNRVI